MSWLFGLGKGSGGSETPDFSSFLPPPPGDDGGDKGDGGKDKASSKMEAYRFDSAALERAANAAKELERSRELINHQIISKNVC